MFHIDIRTYQIIGIYINIYILNSNAKTEEPKTSNTIYYSYNHIQSITKRTDYVTNNYIMYHNFWLNQYSKLLCLIQQL